MQEKRTLYLAGKITGDPYYFTKFYNAQKKLEEGGFIVVNPALLPAEGFTWEAYMRMSGATAPALQRDADVYELALADIYVGAGVTAITQSKITDQRLNTSLCGVVAAVVQQIDTAAFNAQLQAWFAEYQSLSAAEYNTLVSYMNSLKLQGNTQYEAFEQHMADFETQAAADFNAWFNGLQNVLDDNAATNLLNITNALDARVDMLEAVLFNDITTNPFLILFDDLDGVTSTGIWNESLQRIEC